MLVKIEIIYIIANAFQNVKMLLNDKLYLNFLIILYLFILYKILMIRIWETKSDWDQLLTEDFLKDSNLYILHLSNIK